MHRGNDDFQRSFYETGYESPPQPSPRRAWLDSYFPAASRIDVAVSTLKAGSRLLDVGCGDGELLDKAASLFPECYGVDVAANRVEKARQKLTGRNTRFDIRQWNIDTADLPFSSGHFDAVTCIAVLPFVFDVDHALGEMVRVLRRDGRLVIQTSNLGYIGHRLTVLTRGEICTSRFHGWDGNTLHYFSVRPLLRRLAGLGLEVEQLRASGRMSKLRSKWVTLLGSDMIVIARKSRMESSGVRGEG
jgi:2-polyprenyl-3-methyl-5-hydroxy-6-metoxy-1,4-benzoquinol methylase